MHKSSSDVHKQHQKTLLLVEDEALIAMDEARTLQKYGFTVIPVYDGQKAIETVKQNRIDLILMDIDLGPGKMDGTQTAKAILNDRDLPIIFLSSHTEPEVVEKTEKITAYGYVVKNTGETVLINAITMAFRLFEAKKESQRNERMLMAALDNSHAGIAIAEAPSGKLRYVNDAGLLIRGGDRTTVVNGVGVDQYVSSWRIKDVNGRPLETDEVPLARAIKYGETNSRQFIVEREDHDHRIVMANAAPVLDERGEVESAIVIFLDVTEHMRAEKELYHINELLKRTEHIAHVGGWEWDVVTDTITWSEELYAICGLDPSNPPPQFNKDHYKIYTKESWDKLTSAVDHTLETGESYRIQAQMVRPDAEIRDVYIYGGAKFGNDGSVTGLFGIVQDVTDTLRLEAELRISEEDLRITLYSISDAVISTDLRGNVVRMNPVAEELTGWEYPDAKGKALDEVFHIVNAETGATCTNPVESVLQSGRVVGLANHTKLISKDGREYQIADSASPIKDPEARIRGVVLVFRDVTEEYNIREALRKNEKRLNSLFTSMTEGVGQHALVYDDTGKAVDYRIIDVNPAFENILNLPSSAVRGKLATEAYQVQEPPYLDLYARVIETKEPLQFTTYYTPMKKYFQISVFPTEEDKFATVFSDITELTLARDKLKAQKDFIEQIAETSPITITKVDRDGRIVYANSKAGEVLGLERDRITTRTYHGVEWKITDFEGGYFPEKNLPFNRVQEKRETVYDVQHAIEWPNGERKLLSINATPLFDEKGEFDGMVASITDITERHRIETDLKNTVKEKNFLMRELHHRVKNNLSMINSLIHLKDTSMGETVDLSDLTNQIDTIRIVHEKLYRTGEISHVDAHGFISDLLSSIFDSRTAQPVTVKQNIALDFLNSKIAMPLGLIINEIATNALKHGFDCEEENAFTVELTPDEERDRYILTLANTGRPFPEHIGLQHPETLDLQLIAALVNQLEGTIDLQRRPYPIFTITIPR